MHLKYISSTRIFSSRFTKIFLLFCACAFIGSSIGKIVSHNTARQTAASAQSSNWGLSFQEEGKRPVGNATIEELAQYNAFFAEDTEEKKIYLTFDAGFENGNTPAILDALKKHQAPATFFVVGNFISENKDLIKRMETEGHIVGNHTMTHPDMSKISTKESFQKELSDVEKIYREITGKEMTKFYRPPQGIYSTQNLSMARELGYHTFFWSLAYVDWYQDNQPDPQEAIAKLTKRIHPGAIVLLHSTSSTNAQILDELLVGYENLQILAKLRGGVSKSGVEKALEVVGLHKEKRKVFSDYSLGMKQRLGIAAAIMHEPELLILDEPINGLDPIGIVEIRSFLSELSHNHGITIFISSHVLSEIEQIADIIGVMHEGHLVEEVNISELHKRNRKYIQFDLSDSEIAGKILENHYHMTDFTVQDGTVRIYDFSQSVGEINREFARNGLLVTRINDSEENLEDYFSKLIGGGGIA